MFTDRGLLFTLRKQHVLASIQQHQLVTDFSIFCRRLVIYIYDAGLTVYGRARGGGGLGQLWRKRGSLSSFAVV